MIDTAWSLMAARRERLAEIELTVMLSAIANGGDPDGAVADRLRSVDDAMVEWAAELDGPFVLSVVDAAEAVTARVLGVDSGRT